MFLAQKMTEIGFKYADPYSDHERRSIFQIKVLEKPCGNQFLSNVQNLK
jgi:hypothetical protein